MGWLVGHTWLVSPDIHQVSPVTAGLFERLDGGGLSRICGPGEEADRRTAGLFERLDGGGLSRICGPGEEADCRTAGSPRTLCQQ